MGRTEPSRGLQPAAKRKEVRAKNAKSTVNKTIPALISSTPRASKGMKNAELIVNPAAPSADNISEHQETGKQPAFSIRVVASDTLPAAYNLQTHKPHAAYRKNVAILNMASPLRPGGGVLNGATSQEETLCTQTTLLPSLREEFYRLPELGGVFTPDVLVFRDAGGNDLPKNQRWYIDVISAGMLRFPDLHEDDRERYASRADERAVEAKMVAVLRILVARGVEEVVLGAWGCGAYGNPVGAVARAWRKVLLGDVGIKGKDGGVGGVRTWGGLKEVVFAIKEVRMAEQFAEALGVEVEQAEEDKIDGAADVDANDDERAAIDELESKVAEMEEQMSRVLNPDLKQRLESVLSRLKNELLEKKEYTK